MTQVSGLVLCLNEDERLAARALEAVRGRAGLELGTARDPRRVPAVLEEASRRESRATLQWLEQLEGIVRVEVSFVSVEGAEFVQSEGS